MKIEVLGTGTSQGVPVIGCDCEVCQSTDARDQRLRCAIWVSTEKTSIVIDAGPDFRYQMLRAGVKHLDAVVLTHEHNDHIIGIDDVRPFNFRQKIDMPVYATPVVQGELRKRFEYVFKANPYPGAPRLLLKDIKGLEPFEIGDIRIVPIQLQHGPIPVLGFRINDFVYITDAKEIAAAERDKIRDCKYLIINALHKHSHHSHFNLEEALEVIEDLQPSEAYLTHISHLMGKTEAINKTLPNHINLAFDGLQISLPE